MKSAHAIKGRDDISRFVVHLTRDDSKSFTNGGSARKNFLSILKQGRIGAFQSHCLFNPKLARSKESIRKEFRVACFTETPLNQLHLLVREIPGRSVLFQSYGFCFRKEFIIERGGQQAVYINSYGKNLWLYDAATAMFDKNTSNGLVEPDWRILPFLNAMHEKYDFSWEREWRIRGDLEFDMADVVCVVLPTEGEEKWKGLFAEMGIASICPGWTYEEIVAELATQQRVTKERNKLAKKLEASG